MRHVCDVASDGHVLAHAGLTGVHAECEQLPMDAWRAPERILSAHSTNQLTDVVRHRWSSWPAATALPRPVMERQDLQRQDILAHEILADFLNRRRMLFDVRVWGKPCSQCRGAGYGFPRRRLRLLAVLGQPVQ